MKFYIIYNLNKDLIKIVNSKKDINIKNFHLENINNENYLTNIEDNSITIYYKEYNVSTNKLYFLKICEDIKFTIQIFKTKDEVINAAKLVLPNNVSNKLKTNHFVVFRNFTASMVEIDFSTINKEAVFIDSVKTFNPYSMVYENDIKNAKKILISFIKNDLKSFINTNLQTKKYYYNYSSDRNSLYSNLINNRTIAIEAKSIEEAIILDYAINFIFDELTSLYNFYANTFDIQGYYFYLRSQNNKVDTESIIELINNNKNYLDINNNPKKWIISFIDKNIDYKNRKLSWEKKIQSLSNYGRFKLKKILIVRLFSDNEVEMEKEFPKRERELDSIKVNNYFNYIVEDSNIRNYLNYENINPLKPKQKILQIYELEIETIDPLILDKNDVLKILNLDINTGLTTSDFLDKIFNI